MEITKISIQHLPEVVAIKVVAVVETTADSKVPS